MANCKKIGKLISLSIAGEISEEDNRYLQKHIGECPACAKEFEVLENFFVAADKSFLKADVSEEEVDFGAIMREQIHLENRAVARRREWKFSFTGLKWQPALSLIGVFIVGILTGYAIFQKPFEGSVDLVPVIDNVSVDRIEKAHAKMQVKGFLKESQMILTDMMRERTYGDAEIKRAGGLLRKGRYFKNQLNSVELMSSKKLLEKILWVLYEISAMDENYSVKELNRLQLIVEKEKLLMKIRLVEKELEAGSSRSESIKELKL